MKFCLRPYTYKDKKALTKLLKNSSETTRKQVSSWHQVSALLEIMNAQPRNVYPMIGLLDRKAVCFGKLKILGPTRAEIIGVIVVDDEQSKGYGTLLMNILKEMAIVEKIKTLEVEVFKKNRRAIKFYKGLGYKMLASNPGWNSYKMEIKL